MIICGFLFFSVFFLFYGLLFNLDKIEGDLYLHNLIMYVSEMIAELNTGYILSRYKRIPTFIAINSLSFICCLVLIYFDGAVANIALFAFSFFLSMSFVLVFCYTAEVFEPGIRNASTSLGMLMGSLSLILMPYILSFFSSTFLVFLILLFIKIVILMRLKETWIDNKINK